MAPVRSIAADIKHFTAPSMQPDDVRPWGEYYILADEEDHKVKRLVINPGKRFSYQRHQRRSEDWIVVSGRARFTLDDKDTEHGPGEVLHVPLRAKHRLECVSRAPLVVIEVQLGDYFGEDDIERFEDDFGRS